MSDMTPNLMETVEKFIDAIRELAKIPPNVRFLVFDANTPLELLIEKIKEHYPFKETKK